jgi:para-aminobenzoate synthetase/4-amino-4-deoxychorismate lyase
MAPFNLIETMVFVPGHGLRHETQHLDRLFQSAGVLAFKFDPFDIGSRLDEAMSGVTTFSKVRLVLMPCGAIEIAITSFEPDYDRPVTAAFAQRVVRPDDIRLSHKTSDRSVYDRPASIGEVEEVIFVDRQGFITEGSFNTVFLICGDTLLTPPLARGVLPGVLRRILLESRLAIEHDLRPEECGDNVLVGNSARGLRRCIIAS